MARLAWICQAVAKKINRTHSQKFDSPRYFHGKISTSPVPQYPSARCLQVQGILQPTPSCQRLLQVVAAWSTSAWSHDSMTNDQHQPMVMFTIAYP